MEQNWWVRKTPSQISCELSYFRSSSLFRVCFWWFFFYIFKISNIFAVLSLKLLIFSQHLFMPIFLSYFFFIPLVSLCLLLIHLVTFSTVHSILFTFSLSIYLKEMEKQVEKLKKEVTFCSPCFLLIVLCSYSSYNMCTHTPI